jgi:hypothetical protein
LKKEIRTNEVLKRETHKERKPDLGLEKTPEEGLTKAERDYLTTRLMGRIAFHYEQTAKGLGLLNDHEKRTHGQNILQSDAYNDGVLAFFRCLDKFDKKGRNISDVSVFGSTNPKTIDFYFFIWAKDVISQNLLDDLKVVRSHRVYSVTEAKSDESSDEFVPASQEKEQNTFDLFHRILNGMGGESVASKILAVECNNNYDLIWYIFNKKIENVRDKTILEETMEKDTSLNRELFLKFQKEEELTEEEGQMIRKCKDLAKAKIKILEVRTAKIFSKIRSSADRNM